MVSVYDAVDMATVWKAVNYADYDPATGVFAYDWDDGTHEY